ncbi:Uncharacterised protein [uncultured archaeon]|nr:Uncharacterised protein [uncultured archaeon]
MRLLQEILGSKPKIGLLERIIDSEESFSMRDLARLGGMPKSTVSLVVNDWQKAGLLDSQAIGNAKVVKINRKFALYPYLAGLFGGNGKIMDSAIKKIESSKALKSKDVVCAILFGSLAKKDVSGQSDADLLVITKKSISEGHPLNSLWDSLYGEIPFLPAPVFMTKKEAMERLKEKDGFMLNVFRHGIALKGRDWFVSAKRAF